MDEDDSVSREEAYGDRIPSAYDIEALAVLLKADHLSADTRKKIEDVVNTYLRQFKSVDNT